ncbi:MAG TPA: YtxH domain-containing protein [Bacilli bacterium]|nr:YtxH domain-containing protein [Bacilli bacterium]
MKKNKGNKGKFIIGAAVGAVVALLFAKKTGVETRKALKKRFDELLEKAKEIDINEVRDTIEEKVEELKKELEDLDQEKALELAKKKGKVIQEKVMELVEYTKEKGTPVLEDAVVEIKNKTTKLLKIVIEKLEEDKK